METRSRTVQAFLDFYQDSSYLEIGGSDGLTFHEVTASRKTLVSPKFSFSEEVRQSGSVYVELDSDAYFASLARDQPPFDVVFLDGVHTFEQTLRDLLAAIIQLAPDGIIIVDDVIPSSYQASFAEVSEFERFWQLSGANGDVSWMGDVFKLVFFIESFLPAFAYATTSDNHGQLVMWRGARPARAESARTVETITRLEYKHTVLFSDVFNRKPLVEILALARKDVFEGTSAEPEALLPETADAISEQPG